jgi:AAA family ATP:ADP antiporter
MQLANVLSTESLFYACIIPFIIFFGAFAFVMYPLRDVLHPTGMPSPKEANVGMKTCIR